MRPSEMGSKVIGIVGEIFSTEFTRNLNVFRAMESSNVVSATAQRTKASLTGWTNVASLS